MSKTESEGTKLEILSKVDLFKDLNNKGEALFNLSKIMQTVSMVKGHSLLKEGEFGADFFILISGQVSVFKKTTDGDLYKVAILTGQAAPGLGEGGLIQEEPRSATIVCDSDCQFLKLDRGSFSQFCDQHPEWALPILKKIAGQLIARLAQTNRDILLLHKALMNEIRG